MCIVCVSTVTVASLLAPTQAPVEVKPIQKNIQEYEFTNKSCSKSNLNKVKNNTICLKNGKVYRWAVKKSPVVKPTPTPIPTPTPTPSAKTQPVEEVTTLQKIYKKITDYYNNKSDFKLTVIKSPLVNEKRVLEVVQKYETAINAYPVKTNRKITWVFVSEEEKQWYVKKSLEIDNYDWTSWWDKGKCFISSSTVCAYGNSDTRNPIFYMVIGSKSSWTERDQMNAEHEAAHIYQMITFTNGYPSCWVVEGQANALGIAMASRYKDVLTARNGQILEMSKFVPNYQKMSKQQWIDLFKKYNNDNDSCIKDLAGYSLGMVAVESLFLNSSASDVDKFIINYSQTMNLEKSLNSVLNIGLDQFYSNFADHMINALQGR
jgi:hypothetical protein